MVNWMKIRLLFISSSLVMCRRASRLPCQSTLDEVSPSVQPQRLPPHCFSWPCLMRSLLSQSDEVQMPQPPVWPLTAADPRAPLFCFGYFFVPIFLLLKFISPFCSLFFCQRWWQGGAAMGKEWVGSFPQAKGLSGSFCVVFLDSRTVFVASSCWGCSEMTVNKELEEFLRL